MLRWAGIAGVFVALAVLGRAALSSLDAVAGFSPAAGFAAAMVRARPRSERWWAVVFATGSALAALAFGLPPVLAATAGVAVVLEVAVATAVQGRSTDPLAKPATAAWWGRWTMATMAGVIPAGVLFSAVSAATLGLSWVDSVVSYVSGHVAGLLLVAPGTWGAIRWLRTGGLAHRGELRQVIMAMTAVGVAGGAGLWLSVWLDQPEPFALPVLMLGWLALRVGHRVTVMASSVVGSAALLGLPWWAALHQGANPVTATVVIVLGHVAASGLAIEASASWHARALLSGVVEIAAEAVLIVDDEGRVMTGNPAARQIFGAALEGRSVRDLLPGLAWDWSEIRPTAALVGGRAGDGGRRAIQVTVGPVEVPGRPMFAFVCRDMTDQRATEVALKRAAEIINATPDLVGWADVDGNPLFINPGGRVMIGDDRDDAFSSWAFSGLLTREALAEAESGGIWHGETRLHRSDGSQLPVSQTVVAHRGDDGAVTYYSTIARDISQRYELEAMKDQFVANVTHELRSPLAAVIGYLELLQEGAFGEVPTEVAEVIDTVNGSAHQLMELINDLLALWRAEGHRATEFAGVPLSRAVEAAVATMEPVAAGKRISIRVAPGEAIVRGDRKQLERALINLVSNAVKFTPAGGSIEVSATVETDRVRVAVRDSGIGIPAQELDAVFERFYRASTAEAADIPGTGLGLPLVLQVARAHGGDVTIESEVGVGTTVTLELPLAPVVLSV